MNNLSISNPGIDIIRKISSGDILLVKLFCKIKIEATKKETKYAPELPINIFPL